MKNQIWARKLKPGPKSLCELWKYLGPSLNKKHLSSFVLQGKPEPSLVFVLEKHREASKISCSHFEFRQRRKNRKEKKIVDANRSNSQVKSCFLKKRQIISYLVQWPLKQPQEVIEFVKIKSQDLVVIHIHSDLVGISFGFLYIFAVCLKKDEFTRPFSEKRCTLHSMN